MNYSGYDRKDGISALPNASDNSRLSLKFLAWYLLNQNVQVQTHDSIEDARTALLLYQKYLELKQAGTLQDTLKDIYDKGNSLGFRPPQTVGGLPSSPTKSEFESIDIDDHERNQCTGD